MEKVIDVIASQNKNLFRMGDRIKSNNNEYRVLRRLGNGGSGTAYLAMGVEGMYSGCYVVIKIFYNIDKTDRLLRFKKEISFLKECNHPSIVTFYEEGTHIKDENEYPFYVMEYMPTNLKSVLQRGYLDIEKSFLYTTQLISALQYMQSKNIIHRDIKPENIFINGNQAILGDFGLLKELNAEDIDIQKDIEDLYSSISNGNAMPRNYRTPQLVEYMTNKTPLTFKTDIFQLGIIVATMFIGDHPLKWTKKIEEPVEFKEPLHEMLKPLNKIGQNKFKGQYIINIINGMMNLDDEKIFDIKKLLKLSTTTFSNYLTEKEKLEGKIFE